jgi:hypothetical protein
VRLLLVIPEVGRRHSVVDFSNAGRLASQVKDSPSDERHGG